MEFLNVLSREEMRNVKGGYMPWSCECTASSGCEVKIDQYESSWVLMMDCTGNGYEHAGDGIDCWGGSACGGACIAMC